MNRQNRIDNAKKVCPTPGCGVVVSNLHRHLRRKRCNVQHIRFKLKQEIQEKHGRNALKRFLDMLLRSKDSQESLD